VKDDGAPAWRYFAGAILCLGLFAYMLLAGELAIDKQKTLTITRAANPFIYRPLLAASGVLGVAALRAAWRRLAV
jgi:hypothetical protein